MSALALTAALGPSSGCTNKEQECKALIAKVEKADKSRLADWGSPEQRKKYLDSLLDMKRELEAIELSDDKLIAIRDAEARNQHDFVFAQREIADAKVGSQLEEAVQKRGRVQKAHAARAKELGDYCGAPVTLTTEAEANELPAKSAAVAPSSAATALPVPAPAASSPLGAASASAATNETWITFRHPTLPFECQFFKTPEVGSRKAPNSITDAAIADDGDRRMFSAAYIVFPSPPTYDCKTIVDAHVTAKEGRLQCRRTSESTALVNGLPAIEATLSCADGATILKRVRCISEPDKKQLILFDTEAIYLRDWDATEARKFVDGAKLLSR